MSGFPAAPHDFSSSTLNNNHNSTRPFPMPNTNSINNNNNSLINYNQQRPGLLPIRSQNLSSFGKRTLADFQAQQQHQLHNPILRHLHQQQGFGIGVGSRSVKPRIYQNLSSISTVLPEIASVYNISSGNGNGRYAVASMLRPQNTTAFGTGSVVPNTNGVHSFKHNLIQNGVVVLQSESTSDSLETEKAVIMNRLQELEKQLLDDDVDDQAGDNVSVITGNEWTETIQSFLVATSPHQQQPQQQQHVNTSSPTSSSSSCSSTVASPLPICCKQLVTEAAAAIADGKFDSAADIVTRVMESANQRGTPEQRLAYYMSLALKSKLRPVDCSKSASSICSKEYSDSVQLLYHHSNCFKLGFLSAILAIIEATADAKSLHIVDFDLGDGKQYHTLLQFLSLRKSGKPTSVKITAVDVLERIGVADDERLRIGSERLSQLSERVGIPLEVKTLRLSKIEDVTRESLNSNENEVMAVNAAHILSKLPDESVSIENQRDELLRRVKGLKPRIVTVVEQEMNCNTAPFRIRMTECSNFYSALFDSLDNSGMNREDTERIRVEEGLGRVMMNTLTCEGVERVVRCEVLGKWRARMGMAGFEMKPVSQNVIDSLSSMVINKNSSSVSATGSGGVGGGTKLFVKEINGGVGFGWMDRIVTVTSTWR